MTAPVQPLDDVAEPLPEKPAAWWTKPAALWTNPRLRWPIVAGIVAFAVYEITRKPGFQAHNTYVWFANSLLEGRLDMPAAPIHLDYVEIAGRKYSHQGPLPAVLLMPFVAIWRFSFNIQHFAALVGAGISGVAFSLATRIGLYGWRRIVAWLFPVFGTSIWYEAKMGETWGVAALCSVLMLMLALHEYFGKRRPWVVGFFVGLAALCRPGTVLTLGGLALAFRHPRRIIQLGLGAVGPLLVMVGWNYARTQTIVDRAFEIFYERDAYRLSRPPGIFSPAHIPHNVYSWVFRGPGFTDEYPYLRPNLMGTGLVLTSPAFLAAFGAKRERWLWVCAGIVVIPAALFYANGFVQFGMRYLLDTIPFLFALVAVAMREGRAHGYLPLLIFSVAMNLFGVLYTNNFDLQP